MISRADLHERGKNVVIKSVNLETVVGITSALPENTLPEYAFAGKSNVGKSSLINAVMNRKAYARVSGEPGKTQTINYYNINNELYLVDLPGYGYAKVSQSTKEKWGKMIERYLKRSRQLRIPAPYLRILVILIVLNELPPQKLFHTPPLYPIPDQVAFIKVAFIIEKGWWAVTKAFPQKQCEKDACNLEID